MKRIVSLWLPRWPADRLGRAQQRAQQPAKAGLPACLGAPPARPLEKPLVFATPVQGAVRITALNAAAEEEGLRPGMGLADARAVLPDLVVEQAAVAADEKALGSLAHWCGRYSPWATVDAHGANELTGGRDGILLDVTGCAHLFGGEDGLLMDLMARLGDFRIQARTALADTPGAAWAVARFGDVNDVGYAIVPPGGSRDALGGLPVAALRLGREITENLGRLGLKQVRDLLSPPRAPLVRRFGFRVARALDQALGHEDEPISPDLPRVPYRARLAFLEPVGRVEDIAYALETLLERLCALLDRNQRGARRLTLDLFRVDGEVKTVVVGTSRPVRGHAHLGRLFADRLDQVDAGFGIDAAVLSATVTEPLGATQAALPGQAAQPGESADTGGDGAGNLGLLIDRLGNRLGMDKVRCFEAWESFVPERAVATVALASGNGPGAGAAKANDADLWPVHLTRPLRLLSAPEPVEVVAEVPDGPPFLFRWRRGNHRVARVDGPERIGPEWWRAAGPGCRQARDYYRIEDQEGRRFWLFREGLYPIRGGAAPHWYLHGIFA
jgi:protein ImuB